MYASGGPAIPYGSAGLFSRYESHHLADHSTAVILIIAQINLPP